MGNEYQTSIWKGKNGTRSGTGIKGCISCCKLIERTKVDHFRIFSSILIFDIFVRDFLLFISL